MYYRLMEYFAKRSQKEPGLCFIRYFETRTIFKQFKIGYVIDIFDQKSRVHEIQHSEIHEKRKDKEPFILKEETLTSKEP